MMEAYKNWVRQNRQWISSLENLANTATWFLPERFVDSELTPESVSTLLGLVTVMNQHIIETSPPPSGGTGVRSHHSAEPEHDGAIPWSLCMSVVKEVEVLTEMVADYYLGKDKKWGPVASVEAIKVLIRLIILRKNGYKMLLDGGETKNVGDVDPTEDTSSSGPSSRQRPDWGMRHVENPPTTLQRREDFNPGFYPRDLEGRAMQAMHKFSNTSGGQRRPSWLTRRQQEEPQEPLSYSSGTGSVEQTKESHRRSSRAFIGGEILLISRPLLYVLLVWRYGLRSWRPWVAALSIDLAGMYLVSSSTSLPQRSLGSTASDLASNAQEGSRIPLSTSEVLELRKRKLRWAFYVLRDPFFSRFTRRQVEAAEKILSPIPLVGMLAGKAVELLGGVQGIYSYTAAS